MQENVFLIGFMGAGKSRLGKRLAKKMDARFLDADREIEAKTGKTVEELFETVGEAGFREIETAWLKELDESQTIIALGGGTPCFNNNMELINQKGKSVYLYLSPKLLVNRLQNSKSVRPLIEPFKTDEVALLNFIEEKLIEREPFYKQAHLVTTSMSLSAARITDLIKKIEEIEF